MVKPEWGTKRSCPKCSTRFYDLQNEDPVTCINCGFAWVPEPILKSKQPLPFEAAKPQAQEVDSDEEVLADDDLDLDADDTGGDDADVSLDDDDDLSGVVERDEDDEA